jgi:hypothetical protein
MKTSHSKQLKFAVTILVALPVFASRTSPAHAETKQHVFVEGGGLGVMASVNYEIQPLPGLALRAGHGAVLMQWGNGPLQPVMITPLGVSYFTGAGAHHAEFGVGASVAWTSDSDARFLSPSFGYRYQRREGGVVLRANVAPLMRMNDLTDVLPWGSLSVGYAF